MLKCIPSLLSRAAKTLLYALPVAALLVQPAAADRLQDILSSESVKIGVVLTAPPNGFMDENGKLAGFDPDLATKIAEYLGAKVELVPLANNARIPALQAGQVDFLVASLAPTPERAKTIMFTMPYSAADVVVIAGKDDSYADLSALAGKRLGLVRGSPQDASITAMNLSDVEMFRYEDGSTTMQALLSGQVDAVVNDQIVLSKMLASRPDLPMKEQFIFSRLQFSAAVMPGEFELLQWLNTTINFMKNNGDLDTLGVKWYGVPVKDLSTF